MADRNVLINENTLYGIADAIRNKSNTSNTYKPSQMANAITGIPNNSTTVSSINITENGEYTAPSGTAYSPVNVNVSTTTIESLNITSNGTYTAPIGTAYSPITVNVESSGGSIPSVEGGLRFIDYDGMVLHTYSTAEALALSALPSNPSHTGLTAQGWNWTLAQIQDYLTDYPEALVTVGQMYITDDGKTRIYVHMEEGRLSPYLGLCVNGSVEVDWGDNSSTDTLTGTSTTTAVSMQHTYSTTGDYVISLNVINGNAALY